MVDEVLKKDGSGSGVISVSDAEAEEIAPGTKTINLGRPIRKDWNGEQQPFIGEMYEQFLQAVQQGKSLNKEVARFADRPIKRYDQNTTFEDYLLDALATVRYRLAIELPRALSLGQIDVPIRDNNRDMAEAVIRAIRKYLEGTKRERLIGVPEPGFGS